MRLSAIVIRGGPDLGLPWYLEIPVTIGCILLAFAIVYGLFWLAMLPGRRRKP